MFNEFVIEVNEANEHFGTAYEFGLDKPLAVNLFTYISFARLYEEEHQDFNEHVLDARLVELVEEYTNEV